MTDGQEPATHSKPHETATLPLPQEAAGPSAGGRTAAGDTEGAQGARPGGPGPRGQEAAAGHHRPAAARGGQDEPAGGFRRLWGFYLPLAASDLLMGASETAVNAGIARLAAPELSLAVYGAVIATCLLIESPVIMLLHAGNALATHPQALRRLQQFTLLLAGTLTLLHGALAFTGLFDLYFGQTLGLDGELLALVRPAFAVMLPWTAAIAWRRLHQGLLIRHGHTAVASRGTVIRLATLGTVLAAGGSLGMPGALAGCAGLAAAVTAEAAYVHACARRWLQRHWPAGGATEARDDTGAGDPGGHHAAPGAAGRAGGHAASRTGGLSWRGLLGFYIPLALTSVTTFAARPVLTGLLARAADATVALAAWPVTWSTVLLFMLPMRTVEQVAIAHGEDGAWRAVRGFAWRTGLGGVLAMALLSATPAAGAYLAGVVAVSGDVAAAARWGLLAMIPVPLVVALASCEAGRLVRTRRTVFIHLAALANVGVLTATAFLVRLLAPALPGTVIAAVALLAAYGAEWAVLAAGTAMVARTPAPLRHGAPA
ncbi:hypothetical protein DYI95_003905 [Thermaerobacter sp. PB12/4term]|uniref:hypothetical protein n=1 Tax=Thermaerobacter sp. PB12/4term TaxID=2293838 RepID=UPI000E328C21|nr:hypothetical protein [Thermaerobacter sp. PB12/4term]QIA26779.1 hypothetical protein DYI95_003905 [Thermaerobacter sp. PB12/4term]